MQRPQAVPLLLRARACVRSVTSRTTCRTPIAKSMITADRTLSCAKQTLRNISLNRRSGAARASAIITGANLDFVKWNAKAATRLHTDTAPPSANCWM